MLSGMQYRDVSLRAWMSWMDALFWLRDNAQLETAGVPQVLVETVFLSCKAVRTHGRLVGTVDSC